MPYVKTSRDNPCDTLFREGVDHVFVPFRRASGDVVRLSDLVADASLVVNYVPDPCKESARRLLCYFYYPPCGNSTIFEPPNTICSDTCLRVQNNHCASQWDLAVAWFSGNANFITERGLNFIDCNDPGAFIYPLPHCCSDAGICEFVIESLKSTTALSTCI